MKKLILKQTLLFSLIILMASCVSHNFGSRKYTAGKYRETKHKAPKVRTIEQEKEEPVYASTEKGLSESEANAKSSDVVENTAPDPSSQHKFKKKAVFNPIKNIKDEIRIFKNQKHEAKTSTGHASSKNVKTGAGDGLDNAALMSLIFSVLAVILNVIGFLLVISIGEYFVLLFFAAALAFGIIGLIFGTKGLRNHRKNKGSVLELVFSIVGTALGGISIILAIYYSIWSLIWIALSV